MGWRICLLLVFSVFAQEGEGQYTSVLPRAEARQDYHKSVGIPLAESVRQAELGTNNGSRITNGSPTPLGAFPFAGGLLIKLSSGATSMCSCSLVSPSRAVTAAHCATDGGQRARAFTAVFGSKTIYSGGTRVSTGDVRVHDHYNRANLNNDIAVLILPTVTFSSTVAPVSLPSGDLLRDSLAGHAAHAIGFGVTSDGGSVTRSQFLSNVTLEVISNDACQRVYGSRLVTTSTLCTSGAGGKSICFGDSGGPLVVISEGKPVLVGVSSFVSSAGCQSGAPAGFTRVSSFVPWIQSHL